MAFCKGIGVWCFSHTSAQAAAWGRYTASCVLQLCLWRIGEHFLKKGTGELQHLGAKNQHVFLKNASQKPTQEEVQFQAFSWGNVTGDLVPSLL